MNRRQFIKRSAISSGLIFVPKGFSQPFTVNDAAFIGQTVPSAASPPPSGTAMFGSITPGTLRNDFTGQVGCKFFCETAMHVTALGRYVVSGNSANHLLSLYDQTQTLLTSITVATSGATAGQFTYASLLTSIALTSGDPYFLFSTELTTGDSWCDLNTATTFTVPADFLAGGAYVNLGGTFVVEASGAVSYVPPNLLYTKP